MTRDEIIAMAREACFVLSDNATDEAIGRFASFAALVAADEREPLTDEQIMDISRAEFIDARWPSTPIAVARAIERAHGIV